MHKQRLRLYGPALNMSVGNLRAELFVILTIHLCNGLNDNNLVKSWKTCFITV